MNLFKIYENLSKTEQNRYEPISIYLNQWTTDDIEDFDDEVAADAIVDPTRVDDRSFKNHLALTMMFLKKYARTNISK